MSNSCFTVGSHCFSAQTPDLQERDIRGRGSWAIPPASQQGAPLLRDPVESPSSTFRASSSFHSDSVPMNRDFAASSKPPRPGASSFERLISDAYLFSRLAARSREPRCVTGYDLAGRAASLHAPPKGWLPPTDLARRLPRHGAPGRALQPIRRNQSTANTEPLFR